MKNKLSTIIIDDEVNAQNLILALAKEYDDRLSVVAVEGDYQSALKSLIELQPELIFIDINLKGESGIELIKAYSSHIKNDPFIIYTTAYENYMLDAIRVGTFDYLTKPIFKEDFDKAMHRVFEKIEGQFIHISNHQGKFKINPSDIIYIEASGPYATFHLANDKRIVTSKGLSFYETSLEGNPDLVRCHKSFIVNVNHITSVALSQQQIHLSNKSIIGFSRTYRSQLFEIYDAKS